MSAEAAKVIQINPEAALEQKSLTLYEQATALVICDQATYTLAGELGKGLKDLEKEITEYFEPLRVTAKAAYDQVLDRKKAELAPVEEALSIVKATMNKYAQEQDRIRREAEAKARIAAEEEARKEREKLLAQAAKADEKGQDGKAELLFERAENVYVAPVSIAPELDKTVKTADGKNITQAKELQITVVDVKAFMAELLKRNMAPTMIEVKAGPLKAWVKANALSNFPGLAIKETVSVRL